MTGVRAGMVLLFTAVAGCGGGGGPAMPPTDASGQMTPDASGAITDVSGWYQVTSNVAGPCGMTKTDPVPIDYVWVERLQNTFIFHVCSGTTEATCTGTLFYDFTTPIPDGLSAKGGEAFFSAGCTLTDERDTLTLIGNELHVHSLEYSVNQDLPESQCTLDAAEALTTPCTYETDVRATRL
jgi:hypothetical protein